MKSNRNMDARQQKSLNKGNDQQSDETQRIDKWLWHARFARTRTAAQRLARSGHIRLNRVKIGTPSRAVRVGDVLTIALGRGVQVIEIAGFAARRGSSEIAQTLYVDHTPAASPLQSETGVLAGDRSGSGGPAIERPAASKRPGKRDRRRLVALKRMSPE